MAVPRSRPAPSPRKRSRDRLAARDLEFCARINRAKSGGADWRRRLDHQEMVARNFHGLGKSRLGRSLAAKFGPRISQHRSNPWFVFQRHGWYTRDRMEQELSTYDRDSRSAREHTRIRTRPRRRLFSGSTST